VILSGGVGAEASGAARAGAAAVERRKALRFIRNKIAQKGEGEKGSNCSAPSGGAEESDPFSGYYRLVLEHAPRIYVGLPITPYVGI
jgi:hypothetical protein